MTGRPLRFPVRQLVLAVVLAIAQLPPTSPADEERATKQVLVLYSTRRDAQFSIVGERDLPRILDRNLAGNLDYYSEFIDLGRFPDPAYQSAFDEFLRLKYQDVRFDLVIAMQDAAIEFVNSHNDILFGEAPVVFLTNTATTGRRRPNSTGLINERRFAATVDLLRQLQPDVENVFVVTGAARVDEEYENAVRRQLQSVPGLAFTYLAGLETRALEDRLSSLPPHSAVYYVLVTEDAAGRKFHPLEYVGRVAATANAPTYCWVDSAMNRGIVGGSLYSQQVVVERVGELALRILKGEPAGSIPVAELNPNTNQVDWRELRRWGIDEARVPRGTLVLFRNPTIWDQYKIYIVAAIGLFATQTALITGLLIQRNRRRRAEETLREHQAELRRSYQRNRDLGARLLRAQETERSRIARELHDDICQRMLLLTIELEALGRTQRDQGPAAAALRVAQDVSKSLHELSHQLHPARLRMIGLVHALDSLCLELSRAGVAIAFTHDDVPDKLPHELMLSLFRVVQEALQNAVKYSKARELSVRLTGGAHGLTLTIIDNGVGFDVDAAWNKGVGIGSMVERLEALGGSLDIRSAPGVGTRVTATVPPDVVRRVDEEPERGAAAPSVRQGAQRS